MKINERGFWENPTNEGHGHDEGLAKALVQFFDDNNYYAYNLVSDVLDVGCGDGFYTNYITQHSRSTVCMGIDGNPHTRELGGTLCSVQDVTKPLHLTRVDWVLSLEVGEHIPQEYEEIFLNNLHRHNRDGIVLSWAVRGQGGDGHVNCKDNEEIIPTVCSMGYDYDIPASMHLREQCAEYPNTGWWFRRTIMVFRKKKG